MKRRITRSELVRLVGGDDELVSILISHRRIVDDDGFGLRAVDQVLATQTLLRELELNWPGIDVVLHMREQLARARRRIAELEDLLARHS